MASELTEFMEFVIENPNYHIETLINGNVTECANHISKVTREMSVSMGDGSEEHAHINGTDYFYYRID